MASMAKVSIEGSVIEKKRNWCLRNWIDRGTYSNEAGVLGYSG
jgi:hypothetical protein